MEWKMFKSSEQDVFGVKSNLRLFITKAMNDAELRASWRQVRDQIANEQRTLDDDFERWNFYVFYRFEGDIDVSLRHLIEHDTISSRKIIVSVDDYTEDDFDKLIDTYIRYSFEREAENTMPDFDKDATVVNILEDR